MSRFVPIEWLRDLRAAMSERGSIAKAIRDATAAGDRASVERLKADLEATSAAFEELRSRRIPDDADYDIRKPWRGDVAPCSRCRGAGFEMVEAMTDHTHPVAIEWPCRMLCANSGRRGTTVVTPEEAYDAWMTRTGGRFRLADEESAYARDGQEVPF